MDISATSCRVALHRDVRCGKDHQVIRSFPRCRKLILLANGSNPLLVFNLHSQLHLHLIAVIHRVLRVRMLNHTDPFEAPRFIDLMVLFLVFILSVHHVFCELFKRAFEFSQNFVNLTQVDLVTKSLLDLSQEGIADSLHLADLRLHGHVLHHVALRVLVDVEVGILQDCADGSDGQTRILLSAQVILAHGVVQQIQGVIGNLIHRKFERA